MYSTCTINPEENECNVAYALRTFPLDLIPAEPRCVGVCVHLPSVVCDAASVYALAWDLRAQGVVSAATHVVPATRVETAESLRQGGQGAG